MDAPTSIPIGLYEKALPDAMSWEERLAAAGQAGYDFIEISIDESDERLSRLDWSASERAALRRSIANTGVKIMSMMPMTWTSPPNLRQKYAWPNSWTVLMKMRPA